MDYKIVRVNGTRFTITYGDIEFYTYIRIDNNDSPYVIKSKDINIRDNESWKRLVQLVLTTWRNLNTYENNTEFNNGGEAEL
jgi:hypothetical protein